MLLLDSNSFADVSCLVCDDENVRVQLNILLAGTLRAGCGYLYLMIGRCEVAVAVVVTSSGAAATTTSIADATMCARFVQM